MPTKHKERFNFGGGIMQLAKSANITAQACPVALTCEYQVNPLGIDTVAPRLSWRMESSARGARQTAYQVLVASSEQALAADQGDLWDSGRVESDQSVQIAYFGKALTSRMQCYWKVRVWDTDGNANAFSAPAFWEMGLLTETDWQAQWIGKTLGRPATMAPAVPAPYFRKEIAVPRQPVAARAYVSGLGYFELSVNGKKVGDHVLDPIFTSYDKRALYVTHDLTPYITQGDNAIGIVLGNGWYNSHTHDVWHFETAPWRDCPKVIAQIYLDYADGTSEIIVTDSSWQVSTGPIVFDGVRNGETYDARLEQPGWDTPHFDAQDWENACIICSPGGTLVAQQQPPTKVMQTITPVSVTEVKPGVFLFDMGQN
ncbi:MAG TPA: alpha-L-rhamnosidase N-terminal domain-containing protein, partial [Armatimonadota bacterium]|nr:alpha-L-rhamnosidase N-terminal domain-containing protein [Armatimonadota bacterium]